MQGRLKQQWREFLASVEGGEIFTFDRYGTVASPVEPKSGAAPALSVAFLCAVIFGLGLWAAPDIAAWLDGRPPVPVSREACK